MIPCNNSSWKLIGETAQQMQSWYICLQKKGQDVSETEGEQEILVITDVLVKEKNISKTQLKRLYSETIAYSYLIAFQRHSGDSGQCQGSLPGGLGIQALNLQGSIRWKKVASTVSTHNLLFSSQFCSDAFITHQLINSTSFVAWSWKSKEKVAVELGRGWGDGKKAMEENWGMVRGRGEAGRVTQMIGGWRVMGKGKPTGCKLQLPDTDLPHAIGWTTLSSTCILIVLCFRDISRQEHSSLCVWRTLHTTPIFGEDSSELCNTEQPECGVLRGL